MFDKLIMLLVSLIVGPALLCRAAPSEQVTCPRGEHVEGGGCIPCPDNTFLDSDNHSNKDCKSCTKAEAVNHEIQITKCNKTHDTEIGCSPGYYRHRNDCDNCWDCSFSSDGRIYTARSCTGNQNTVCCDKPGLDQDCRTPITTDTISSTTVSSLDNATTWRSWDTWVIVVCGFVAVIAIIALGCNTCGIRDKLRACLKRVFPCRLSEHQEPNHLGPSAPFLQEL